MSSSTNNNINNSPNNYYKIRSNYYNEAHSRVNNSGGIPIDSGIINNNPKYINVISTEPSAWIPCVSLEYTGNEYKGNTSHGGIKIGDGFNCNFKAETTFANVGGYNGCIAFAWTNDSLGEDVVPEHCHGSIYNKDNAKQGLLYSSLQKEGIKGITLTLYPGVTYEWGDYSTKVTRYIINCKTSEGFVNFAEELPESIDVYYDYNSLSVEHTSGKYNFYMNGILFASINDTIIDMDTWSETEGYFTATMISSPNIEASLTISKISDNYMHITNEEKHNLNNLGVSVLNYYDEIRDGDDYTKAFQDALKDVTVRRVYVPGGTYKIKGELVVRDNCELELAQDAVLEFKYPEESASVVNEEGGSTNTGSEGTDGGGSGTAAVTEGSVTETVEDIERWTDERIEAAYKCITLKMSSSLIGNHATIRVPYDFDGIVIYASTRSHQEEYSIVGMDPFTAWDPQWKPARYLKDINIVKPIEQNEANDISTGTVGRHASLNGECNGTAIFIEGYRTTVPGSSTYIWGLDYSGLRIAGAFKFGVYGTNNYIWVDKNDNHVPNPDNTDGLEKDWAWTNDMKINGIIDGCEIGVYLYHCNNAYISTIIQPRAAEDNDKTKYAKYGILLEESKNVDLSGSRVWDWTKDNSKYKSDVEEGSDEKSKYQHIAMYGNCSGCIIRDHSMSSSFSFWDKIYYNNPASMFGAVVSGPKGMIPVDSKYAFYKNFNRGSNEYMKNNVTWRDMQNCVRNDVPILPDMSDKKIHKLGYFILKSHSENVVDGTTSDILEDETITIEENNEYGLSGWSNLYFHISKSTGSELLVVKHYWNPLNTVYRNRVPIYYYTIEDSTIDDSKTVTIYRYIKDSKDLQSVYNCKISITNAKRFYFDYKCMGHINDVINTVNLIKIQPELLTTQKKKIVTSETENEQTSPKLAGMFGVVENVPVVTTKSATLNENGEWNYENFIVKELVTTNNSDSKTYTISGSENSIDVKTLDNSFYAQNILLSSENKKFRIIVNDNGTLSTEEINVS